jgi:peptide/nickel transport system substrate-binding protein
MRVFRSLKTGAGALALALIVAACTGSGSGTISNGQSAGPSKAAAKPGGTATIAALGATPDFIFPLPPATNQNGYNANLTQAMWPYLVYAGDGGNAVVNKDKSLFSAISWGDGGKQLTITLKSWNWSDGQPITSRDFLFVYNLLKTNYKNWNAHLVGLFPEDVAKVATPDAHTVVLDLTKAYNPDFYVDNVLSVIPILPQHAWDKTSATGAVGDNDTTPAGAKAVYSYLQKEGAKLTSFSTNPLWKVVSGPWTLSEFRSNGYYSYVPNKAYSGTKPILDKVIQQPFTTDTPEINALRSGTSLDVAPLPLNDIKQAQALTSNGYSVTSVPISGTAGIIPNFVNAEVGPVLSQLYIRQAMESLINRPQLVEKVYNGYADPGNGPVSVKATASWASPLEKSGGPYPYNPESAKSLLQSHGWKVVPGGVSTCTSPGTGATQCGAGIKAGQPLTFNLVYSSGRATTDQQNAAIKSSEAQAGITLNLRSEPFDTLISNTGICTKASHPKASCGWQLVEFGYNPYPLYPTGTTLFDTGGSSNLGGYSDPTMDKLIQATQYSSSTEAFTAYEDYAARQLPNLWLPLREGVIVYRSKLQGIVPLNPFSSANTFEDWSFTS